MVYINNSINNTADEDFLVTTSTAGTDRKISVTNTDNSNAASHAHSQITTGGATGGDPYINFLVSGLGTFSLGIDNSDSDNFKITSGATTSAGTALFTMTSAGVITLNNDLDVSEGGTGVSTLTSHGILMGNGAGDIQATAEPANGKILIGKTGDFPQVASLTSTGGTITVTEGAGTLNVDLSATNPIVQYVYASKTATQDCSTIIPLDDTIPQKTEGDEVLTLAITPKSATNLLVIKFITFGTSSTNSVGIAALFQDTTAGALSATAMGGADASERWISGGIFYVMTAGTTSATTFKVRCGPHVVGHTYINGSSGGRVYGGVASTVLEIWELKV